MYRFRVLDGSTSRFYDLSLDDGKAGPNQFFQIGTDDGLLQKPVKVKDILLAPAERADIVIDFSKFKEGDTIIMRNTASTPYPTNQLPDPNTNGLIMAFKVSLPLNKSIPDAHLTPGSKLNTIIPLKPTPGVAVRQLGLIGTMDSYGRGTPELGAAINMDPKHPIIAASGFEDNKPEVVQLIRNPDGTQSVTEEWKIYNATDHSHPIHIHQTSFQIVSRQKFTWKVLDKMKGVFEVTGLTGKPMAPAANEAGWKDTVRADPGEVTTIVAKFDLPGDYVWHCHILEHEDHDMLHELVVLPAPPATT
jgi:spore coat protein A